MIDQFIETLQKYGTSEESNSVLGLDYTERFSYDEQDRLVDRLVDRDSGKLSVGQFYDAFGIKPEEAQIVKRLGDVNRDKNPFEWLFMMGSLPIKATNSIDDFIAYEIPQDILDITQERIQKLKRKLLDEYTSLYNNPEIPKTVGRLIKKAQNELYDFGVFMFSFGTMGVVREPEEDAYRRALTEQYQANRKRIEENTPQIAETMLATFFKFENEPDTMMKVYKKFMFKAHERRLQQLGIDVSKYVIPIDYSKAVND